MLYKCIFLSNKCAFSDLKYTDENAEYCTLFKERIMWSMYHNNVTFIDEKSFILNDLLKLKMWQDPITEDVSTVTYSSGINM